MKMFAYSVVGCSQDAEQFHIYNNYGVIIADCEEYARREAVRRFRECKPNMPIACVGITLMNVETKTSFDLKGQKHES